MRYCIILVQEITNMDTLCGRCGKNGMLTDNVTGERFCGKCGFVISETLQDAGPEWRSFSKEGGADPTRTGAPTSLTMHDRGLATIINPLNKDASGKPLSTSMKSTIERLRTWDSRSKVNASSDKNLRQALSELATLKDKLSLSDPIIEKAAYIYRKALEKLFTKVDKKFPNIHSRFELTLEKTTELLPQIIELSNFSITKSGGTMPLSRSSNTRDLTSSITRSKASSREI